MATKEQLEEDKKRRHQETTDYGRAQPSELDMERVRNFLDQEARDMDHPQVRRKMGLLVAAMFNLGFDAGLEHARRENGYEKGWDDLAAKVKLAVDGAVRRKV